MESGSLVAYGGRPARGAIGLSIRSGMEKRKWRRKGNRWPGADRNEYGHTAASVTPRKTQNGTTWIQLMVCLL